MHLKRILFFVVLLSCFTASKAQIGKHRNDLSVGVNGGFVMSRVNFMPAVTQSQYPGFTGGLSVKYVSEKYFNTICSIYGEINYSVIGWKENIRDVNRQPVINSVTSVAEEYQRNLGYIQVPIFAHLAWGREYKGAQFFLNLGPQFGFLISESTTTNFDFSQRNTTDRVNQTAAQDTLSVEHKFDYGIAAGLGVEYVVPKVGHFLLEGRYYYGLGNIFGDRKKDYFSRSNIGNIVIKLTYLFDITKTKK